MWLAGIIAVVRMTARWRLWAPDPFTIAGTSVTVAPGASTGNTSTITVTPSEDFTGSVSLTAAITSSPTGAQYPPTLSFGSTTPVSITGVATGMATLTINTTLITSSALVNPKRPGLPGIRPVPRLWPVSCSSVSQDGVAGGLCSEWSHCSLPSPAVSSHVEAAAVVVAPAISAPRRAPTP